jgi:hypothetical protein
MTEGVDRRKGDRGGAPPPEEERRRQRSPLGSKMDHFWLAVYILLIIACAVTMAATPSLRPYAFTALIIVLALMPIGLRTASTSDDVASLSRGDHLDRLAQSIETMTNESGLSEAAKRVLHRRQERELLRREIERDIHDGDWDAAMVLVKELAERFGYRADAEEFRTRIEHARAETLDRTVTQAIANLEALIKARRWTDAFAEAGRIARLYPESPRVEGLRDHVGRSRERYKEDLERRFLQAAERDEIDTAMDLLKELDIYLTEAEAEQFREVARGVIGKARDNLGVRFKLAVQDRNWPAAVEFGERIISDFPNTRMAQEVRGLIDGLRQRAASMPGASQPLERA